jgi:hypothetical protein
MRPVAFMGCANGCVSTDCVEHAKGKFRARWQKGLSASWAMLKRTLHPSTGGWCLGSSLFLQWVFVVTIMPTLQQRLRLFQVERVEAFGRGVAQEDRELRRACPVSPEAGEAQ